MIPNLQIPHSNGIGGAPSPFPMVTEGFNVFSTDHFRMFHFKVRICPRGRSHDWTECPYAHPNEKARRRDLRKYHYSATPCPDFRRGNCNRGESCHLAHGVFECWLHPSRYRTQLCNDGPCCRRKVCFFAHTTEQLRPIRQNASFVSSPTSVLESRLTLTLTLASESPPTSPGNGGVLLREVVSSMRNVQLDGVTERGMDMERAESGMYGKVRREKSPTPDIDIGWVSELVK